MGGVLPASLIEFVIFMVVLYIAYQILCFFFNYFSSCDWFPFYSWKSSCYDSPCQETACYKPYCMTTPCETMTNIAPPSDIARFDPLFTGRDFSEEDIQKMSLYAAEERRAYEQLLKDFTRIKQQKAYELSKVSKSCEIHLLDERSKAKCLSSIIRARLPDVYRIQDQLFTIRQRYERYCLLSEMIKEMLKHYGVRGITRRGVV
ncbi:hypothetical protein SNEBB_008879 [Seison nebaliae]|nr:hypothetical protein SNEBB_008879 [Seison nebaliae]